MQEMIGKHIHAIAMMALARLPGGGGGPQGATIEG
jgi:hypothetical protein